MNPFKRLKQLAAAEKLLRDEGAKGDNILEMCQSAVAVINDQTKALERAAQALEGPDGEVTVKYMVPYTINYSQYANGGERRVANGVTMVDVAGGINNWQQLMGVKHDIESLESVRAYPNAIVIPSGLYPVAEFVPEKPTVTAGTN